MRSFVVSVNNYLSRYIKVNDKTIYRKSMKQYSSLTKIFDALICLRYIQNLTDICCHMKFKRLPHSDIYLEIIGSVVVLDVPFLYCSNHFVCVPSIQPHSTWSKICCKSHDTHFPNNLWCHVEYLWVLYAYAYHIINGVLNIA